MSGRQGLGCAPVAGGLVAVVTLLLWAMLVAALTDLGGSDAAGNAMAQGFTGLAIIVLWVLLTGLLVIAGVTGRVPMAAVAPSLVVLPLSGLAAMTALDLLAHPDHPPWLWPIVVAAAVPPLIVLFCLWAMIPPVRAAIPVWPVAGVVWGAALLVSASILPMGSVRDADNANVRQIREKWDADYARLPRDAPLWDWLAFLQTATGPGEDAVIGGIRHLDRRQSDAELMLGRGDFPLGFLGRIDVLPTPAICGAARALLRRQVASLVLKPGESKPYDAIRSDVESAVAAMQWLVGYDCSCDAEASAWETMASGYRDPGWDVHELRQLRDPVELGRTLRENPAHFAMLSPRSHLKAWLNFAEDKSLRDQALAGARLLDHRNDDAVDLLNGSEYVAWDLLIYLPDLDLDATPALCDAALREVHRELANIYRPGDDNPLPYRDLLTRMGTGRPLRALLWLGQHGCDTGTELPAAENLVRAYQDSPERAAMLATLGSVRPKP